MFAVERCPLERGSYHDLLITAKDKWFLTKASAIQPIISFDLISIDNSAQEHNAKNIPGNAIKLKRFDKDSFYTLINETNEIFRKRFVIILTLKLIFYHKQPPYIRTQVRFHKIYLVDDLKKIKKSIERRKHATGAQCRI